MRYLVTGVAGFIGSAVADSLLARGDSVLGIDSLNDYYPVSLKTDRLARVAQSAGDRFVFKQVDFSDHIALANALHGEAFDAIVHLGAQPGVRYSIDHPRAYIAANIAGHLNLLEIARERHIAHMVYASSSSVYGGAKKVPFAVDDRVDHPMSLYAATKKADELMSETYAHLYRLRLTGLRFFTVYGPWGRPDMMVWSFTHRILTGQPIPVFNHGEVWRDFTYIDDIVAGVVAALDHPPADDGAPKPGGSVAPHTIYNIGNHQCEKLTDVIAVLEKACGREALVEMLPMQPGDVPRTFADISAISRDLGYRPTTSVDVGVPRFVEWYRGYAGL
ncbi:NAD-dependent epimerase/dehydratase family protein [Alteraurantiacibacter palmitatis]|uniref:NAD-dependent epimerase/dehydratase family protein n=1 Tax=Alteraurantiacibacter palmitatis TaxID=2054628 RepID=A0ABV7E858_9SPHN